VQADYFIHLNNDITEAAVQKEFPEIRHFKSFQQHHLYNNNRRINPALGNDFWESGRARPDLILQDLILILHPETDPTHQQKLFYYRHLE
jgi:iron complex transport system substrate-binding protein